MKTHSYISKQFFYWLSFFCSLTFTANAHAFENVVLVANSSHFSLLHRIETAIYAQPNPRPQLFRLEADELVDSNQFDTSNASQRLIVAVGSKATEAVLKTRPQSPVLSILIRKNTYDELISEYQKEHNQTPNMTAVYLDQPFDRQLNLVDSILAPGKKSITIGVLLGPSTKNFRSLLEKEAAHYQHKLHIIHVKNQENVIAALDVLLEDVDVILALPDYTIYNSRTARGLLLSAYRKQVPLIGFSRTYVNNGALAAVYSNPKQVATQTSEVIMEIYKSKGAQLPPPRFPNTYSIAVNYQVSRSLSIDVESEDALHYNIQKNEPSAEFLDACPINAISRNTWGLTRE